MTEPGAERAVVDRTADLEQQIDAISRPSHLLRFVHAPIDQEIRCAFGDRRSDPQTGTVSLGIVAQPRGLASEVFIHRMQRVPQLARRRALRARAVLPLKTSMTLRIRLMLRWAFFTLPFQMRQCRRSTAATIVAPRLRRDMLRHQPVSVVGRQICRRQRRVLQTHRDMKPVQNRRLRYSRVGQNSAQTRTTVGKSGHLGGVDPAHGFKGSLDQRGDVGLGPGDGAKDLAATGLRFDVADANFQVAFAVVAAAYEG
jgi:hypothetical protein